MLLHNYKFDTTELIKKTVYELISCAEKKDNVLFYYFPKNKKKMYYGAAHGLLGIIYMLLKAIKIAP
jgi:hypothetical protein